MSIAANLAAVRARIEAAAIRAGRSPDEVTLMAVTKTFPAAAIREAYEAGIRVFGENRVQEFAGKHAEVASLEGAAFHLIGHLQTNKANKAVELFHAVDSVDSVRLAEKLDAAAAKAGGSLEVLIEINIGGEAAKSGVAPDSDELAALLNSAARLSSLNFRGLMTIPPFTEDPEEARAHFRRVRELRDRLRAEGPQRAGLDVLSMGMSHDFEVAIEEGSSCVRLGTALFGERRK